MATTEVGLPRLNTDVPRSDGSGKSMDPGFAKVILEGMEHIAGLLKLINEQRKVVYQIREVRKQLKETNTLIEMSWDLQSEQLDWIKRGVLWQEFVGELVYDSVGELSKSFESYRKEFQANNDEIRQRYFQEEIRRREAEENNKKNPNKINGSDPGKKDEWKIPDAGFLFGLAMKGLLGALFLKTFDWDSVVRAIRLPKVLAPLIRLMEGLAGISKLLMPAAAFAVQLARPAALFGPLTTMLQAVIEWFAKGTEWFLKITRLGKLASGAFSAFTVMFEGVIGILQKIFAPLMKIIPALKLFARFNPILLGLLAIWDFFTGFSREMKASGNVYKAVFEGLLEVFKGIVTKPLDLLKDGLAWLLDKMGLEKIAEWLRSFSFTEMFDSYINLLKKFWSFVFDKVSEGADALKNFDVSDMFDRMIESLKNLISELWEWLLDQFKSDKMKDRVKATEGRKSREDTQSNLNDRLALVKDGTDPLSKLSTKTINEEEDRFHENTNDKIRAFLNDDKFKTVQELQRALDMNFSKEELQRVRPEIDDKKHKMFITDPVQPKVSGNDIEESSKNAEAINNIIAPTVNAPQLAVDQSSRVGVSVNNTLRGSSNPREADQQRLTEKIQ